MITHELTQGSAEWLAYRATHFNASDAPAMLGVSPYKTRTELLHELHTGLSPEVDKATQRLFDAGHAAEAAARPIAEREIGEDLYPVVGSEGKLSASFDGLTMDESIAWEHKLMNVSLAESLANGIIPESYHPQLEQQLMVSGAEKVLFMATSPDRTAMECVWYTSRPDLRSRILQGWTQFAIDLADYKHIDAKVKAVATPQAGLPAVSIKVNGSIALIDNLDAFGTALTAYVARINKRPETDQDFADLEATVKTLKTAEDALDAAETNALAQTDSIDAMRRTVALYRETARTNRLLVEKLVKAEKENRRAAILREAGEAFAAHMNALNARLGKSYMPAIATDFPGVVKGLKSLDSMKDKADTELARAKIEANEVADRITLNLRTLNEKPELAFLFADVAQLALKAPDDLSAVVQNRIMAHQAAEAERIAAETARIAEQERIKAEAKARQELADQAIEAELAKAQIAAMAAQSVSEITQAMTKKNEVAPTLPIQERGLNFQQYMAAIGPVATPGVAPKEAAHEAPTLKLGQINERLAPISLTADGLASLGFPFVATDKSAKLYRESDFGLICAALVQHINSARLLQAA